jgi:PAS domain S-box-containing protein
MNYLKKELYALIQKDPKVFDFIQESALDGMWYWDLENMEEEWMNPKFWTILGYDPAEMPHKASAWQNIINPDDLKIAIEKTQLHFENPKYKYDQIVRYTHKEGHTVWIQCRGLAIRDANGMPTRMLGAHTDVTSLKKKESELTKIIEITEEQNDRLTNFAHIVSHNLRSHSSNFEMLLSVLSMEHPELEKDELFKQLNISSINLKETIYDLNEIVSINTTFKENMKPIGLKKAVEKCISNNIFLATNSGTKVVNLVDDHFFVKGVNSYVDSILLNLITNGIKYSSPDRDNVITISSEKTKEYIILAVEDNGRGIDLNKYGEKLFGMYKTFHGNEDARGIGLFLTRNQLEAMGGKIEVQSEVDKGSTFKLYFRYEQ